MLPVQPPNRLRVILAGAIGNVMEWYDFAVYGYFAAQIGRQFFPREDAVAQLLSAFGVFALGYLMRPLGGLIIGYIGDRFGRKQALTLSIASMAIPTFLVSILPTHDQIGFAAPVLLTLMRLIQGLSVGGEYTTSLVFMVEHADPRRRGFVGSLACCSAICGLLLGSATGAALAAMMSQASLEEWGWRLPFMLGLPFGLVGLWVRRAIPESSSTPRDAKPSLGALVRDHRGVIGWLAALSTLNAVGFYLCFVYLVSWMQFADKIAPARALEINTFSMLLLVFAAMAGGWLSDRVGRGKIMLLATVPAFLLAFPLFWLMAHPDDGLILLGQIGFVIIIGLFLGDQPATMVEYTPPAVRCTLIALGYNLCLGLIGGLTPLAATWLVRQTNNDLAPAFLIIIAAAVSFAASLSFVRMRASRPEFGSA